MELEITLLSDDNELATTNVHQLKKDIQFFVPEVQVKQLEKQLQPDDAAVSLMDVAVKVLFGGDFIDKVMDVVKAWIEKRPDIIGAKKSKIQLEMKDEKGKSFVLTLENVKDIQATIESLKNFNCN